MAWSALLCCLTLCGCSEQMMARQPAPRPLGESKFFADGMSARPQVAGTVARDQLKFETPLYAGLNPRHNKWTQAAGMIGVAAKNPLGALAVERSVSPYSNEFPFTVTEKVLLRGKERYGIFCAQCHGLAGYGDGMVVQRGFTKPPSYHISRLQVAPAGHFVQVITKGYGAMPAHNYLVAPEDRWAITAYIRALQLSQHANLEDMPDAEKTKVLDNKK